MARKVSAVQLTKSEIEVLLSIVPSNDMACCPICNPESGDLLAKLNLALDRFYK